MKYIMYARYERGANELPVRHLIKLSELYNVSTDYILGLTDDMQERKVKGYTKKLEIKQ